MGVSFLGTGLLIAGKPVPLIALTVSRGMSKMAMMGVRGYEYLTRPGFRPHLGLPYILDDSSGGGGPGESLTSTDSPLPLDRTGEIWGPLTLEQAGLSFKDPSAAGIPHIGGRRSGSKPRKRCPTGFHWNGRRCVKR